MKGKYISIPTQEPVEAPEKENAPEVKQRRDILVFFSKTIALGLLLIFLITTLSILTGSYSKSTCKNPTRRREWRYASLSEREAYIDAVLCLTQQPSTFNSNTSKYDDFVYVHSQMSIHTHYAAAFLAWHRLFIHSYEEVLQGQCGYTGHLMFWDWSLDSSDVAASPIWDTVTGFGSNGGSDECIASGPFAGLTRYYNAHGNGEAQVVSFEPHCTRRNFSTGQRKEDLQKYIASKYVESTLEQPTYETFFEAFEEGAHNAIPQFVRGDFLTFTAPNDPVFFLHHTQVDRLWWIWQQRDQKSRLYAFGGPQTDFRHGAHGESTLDDMLSMMGLTEDHTVRDVMSTETDLLCYVYDS